MFCGIKLHILLRAVRHIGYILIQESGCLVIPMQCLQDEFQLYFIAYQNFQEKVCFISYYDKPINCEFLSGLLPKPIKSISEKMVAFCWNKGILKISLPGVIHFHFNWFVSFLVISTHSYQRWSIKVGITLSD